MIIWTIQCLVLKNHIIYRYMNIDSLIQIIYTAYLNTDTVLQIINQS